MSVGGGRPLPLWGFGGITPENFFENSDAKSCILVASVLISGLPLLAKKLGDQYIVGPPNLNVGEPVSPVPTVVALMPCRVLENHKKSDLNQIKIITGKSDLNQIKNHF